MSVSEILLTAATKIEHDGWCGGHGDPMSNGRGPNREPCLIIAIAVAASAFGEECDAALNAMRGAVGMYVHRWNDERGRTKEEVIAMLRAVAATELARESAIAMREPVKV